MKLTATKSFTFEAAHFLNGHLGKCGNIHGHSYALEVTISSRGLVEDGPMKGMIHDLGDIKVIVNEAILNDLDHALLVEHMDWAPASLDVGYGCQPFANVYVLGFPPTTELLALHISEKLEEALQDIPVQLESVRLQETHSQWVTVTC